MFIKTSFFSWFNCLILIALISSCGDSNSDETLKNEIPESVIEYQNMLKSGKLVVLAENSSTSYFVYREKEMGFEYDILQEFAKEIGVELEVKTIDNLDNIITQLDNKEGDIIACNYTVTGERQKLIDFSKPIIESPQVLIQKKPENWRKMKPEELNKVLITDPSDLAGKSIDVWLNSSYYQRLKHLQEEIGDSIYIQGVDGMMGSDELVELVSQGIIDYTVVEENVASVNAKFYDNIDYSTKISFKQKIAFGLRKSSSLLKSKLDKWLDKFLVSQTYNYIYKKYFESEVVSFSPTEKFVAAGKGQISPFDDIFKQAQAKYGTDWRLVASVAYQESKFNPNVESFGGAYGMMQFMPNTGPSYGVYPDSPVDVQIMGGMKKITDDIKFWKEIPDQAQREKFALASYNCGGGHVKDAQRLARKHGLDPLLWDGNVETMILNLSKQEYYRDPVVKSGAMRGTITHKYVQQVYQRYVEWKQSYK